MYNADGVELSVMTNHLGHFLLANLMLEDLKKGKEKSAASNGSAKPSPRLIIVGSITGNTNTVAGMYYHFDSRLCIGHRFQQMVLCFSLQSASLAVMKVGHDSLCQLDLLHVLLQLCATQWLCLGS